MFVLVTGVSVVLVRRAARADSKDLDGVVNLNTAVPEMLELLPGIGPAKVHSILWYRQRHPFRTVDELVRIKGIGRKMVRRLRAHLAVSGPSTAHAVRRAISFDPPPPPPPAPPARKPGTASPPGAAPNVASTTARTTAKTTAGVSGIARAPAPPLGRGRAPAASSRERRSRADHCARPP
jgi:competence protein ComEA